MRSIFLAALAAVAGSAIAAPFNFTFDADNQGWRRADFNSTAVSLSDVGAATWNAGGFIDGDDFAGWAFHMSPLFVGDQTDLIGQTLEFAFRTDFAGGTEPFVVFRSAAGAIYRTASWTGSPNFVNYSFVIGVGQGWLYTNGGGTSSAATAADFQSVFSGLQRLGITADVASGTDYTALDNVRAGVIPEPATMGLAGLALAAFARRRMRRN